MNEVTNKEFNHLKIHSQYSVCEGALKINDLSDCVGSLVPVPMFVRF